MSSPALQKNVPLRNLTPPYKYEFVSLHICVPINHKIGPRGAGLLHFYTVKPVYLLNMVDYKVL